MDGWMVVASSYGLRSSVEGEREGGPDQKLLMAAFPPLSLNGSSHIPPCINFARDISDPPAQLSRAAGICVLVGITRI